MLQAALTGPLLHEEKKSTRSASCGWLFTPALLIVIASAFLVTQMPWTGSVGVKFIPTRPYALNMAWISTAAGTGEKSFYGNGVAGGPAIPQGLDKAMSHYGSVHYGHYLGSGSRYQDYHYQDYRYDDYRYGPGERSFNYRPRGYREHGNEITYGSHGEPHLAAYRYHPGESEMLPMSRYGGGEHNRYRGGYNDRYGGGYYDRYQGGPHDSYGYP